MHVGYKFMQHFNSKAFPRQALCIFLGRNSALTGFASKVQAALNDPNFYEMGDPFAINESAMANAFKVSKCDHRSFMRQGQCEVRGTNLSIWMKPFKVNAYSLISWFFSIF